MISNHKRLAAELFLAFLTAVSISFGLTAYNNNKILTEDLEMAKNNIEAYEGRFSVSSDANMVLKKQLVDMTHSRDSLVLKLDSVRKEHKIKEKNITTAATLKQVISVNKSKGILGDLIQIVQDTIYSDSLNYNPLTRVHYSISKDTVNIKLDVENEQYLYVYKTREYKNKKKFFKRLITFDFKKVDKYKYTIHNTNDLLKESDIRIITE